MKKTFYFIVLSCILFAGLLLYLMSHANELRVILQVSWLDVSYLGVSALLTQYLNGVRLKFLLNKIGLRLDLWQCFHLSNINTAGNYLPFKGGAFAVAMYFKNQHDISYSHFLEISIGNQLLQIMTIAFVSVLSLALYYFLGGSFFSELFLIFAFLFFLFCIFFILLRLSLFERAIRRLRVRIIGDLMVGVRELLSDKKLLQCLFFLNLISALVMGLRFWFAFKIVSLKVSWLVSLICGQVKVLAMLGNITPSGLGLAEFLTGAVSKITQNSMNMGVFAAALDRIISIIFLLASLALYYWFAKGKKMDLERQKLA